MHPTHEVPQPYHRWASNEAIDVQAYGVKDRCLSCRVARQNPMSGMAAVWSNAVAGGPCPQKDWRSLDPKTDLRAYLEAWLSEGTSTPAERQVLASLTEYSE